jgi:hypothetical protein
MRMKSLIQGHKAGIKKSGMTENLVFYIIFSADIHI